MSTGPPSDTPPAAEPPPERRSFLTERKEKQAAARQKALRDQTDRTTDAVFGAVQQYTERNAGNEFLNRLSVRPEFNVVLNSVKVSALFVVGVLVVMVVIIVLAFLKFSEASYRTYRISIVVVLVALFAFVIMHAMQYTFARADLKSHWEFVQYAQGKTVFDGLIKDADLRDVLARMMSSSTTKKPEDDASATNPVREKILNTLSQKGIQGPSGLYALDDVLVEKKGTERRGKRMFFIILGLAGFAFAIMLFLMIKDLDLGTNLLDTTSTSSDGGVTWTNNSASSWSPRTSPAVVCYADGTVVLIAGSDSEADVWKSNSTQENWATEFTLVGSDMKFGPRVGHAAVVLADGTIVLVGGENPVTGTIASDVWTSGDKGASWTQKVSTTPFGPRKGHSMVVLGDNRIIIAGGSVTNDAGAWVSSDQGTTWTRVAGDLPLVAYAAMAPMGSTSAVLFGGMKMADGSASAETWLLDGEAMLWKLVTPTNSPSARFACAVLAEPKPIIVGGTNGKDLFNETWAFAAASPDTYTWNVVSSPDPGTFPKRCFASAVAFKSSPPQRSGRSIRRAGADPDPVSAPAPAPGPTIAVFGGSLVVSSNVHLGQDAIRAYDKTDVGIVTRVLVITSVSFITVAGILLFVMYFDFYKRRYVSIPERFKISTDTWNQVLSEKDPLKKISAGTLQGVDPSVLAAVAASTQVGKEAQQATTRASLQALEMSKLGRTATDVFRATQSLRV